MSSHFETADFYVHSQVPEAQIPSLFHQCHPQKACEYESEIGMLFRDMSLHEQRQVRHLFGPFEWGTIDNIQGRTGNGCNLRIIAFPLTAAEIHAAMGGDEILKPLVKDWVIRALDDTVERGIRKVGLGGHFSILAGDLNDTFLMREARKRKLILVDGNSQTAAFTAKAILRYLDMACLSRNDSLIGIVGATGSVGRQVAYLLDKVGCKLMLCARHNEKRLELTNSLSRQHRHTSHKEEVYKECDFVLSVTSETEPWNIPVALPKMGQIIFDICVPPSINEEIASLRSDILLIRGVFTSVPCPASSFQARYNHPGPYTYPCSGQLIKATAFGATKNQLHSLPVDELENLLQESESFGFELAPPMGVGYKPLTESDFRSRAA